jgi:hypothetical protein
VTGRTGEGSIVVAGVYRFYETTGLPLDVMFECLRRKDMIPDWLTFYVEAMRAGMKHDRIISKLDPAISDTYGKEFKDTVIERLELIAGSTAP